MVSVMTELVQVHVLLVQVLSQDVLLILLHWHIRLVLWVQNAVLVLLSLAQAVSVLVLQVWHLHLAQALMSVLHVHLLTQLIRVHVPQVMEIAVLLVQVAHFLLAQALHLHLAQVLITQIQRLVHQAIEVAQAVATVRVRVVAIHQVRAAILRHLIQAEVVTQAEAATQVVAVTQVAAAIQAVAVATPAAVAAVAHEAVVVVVDKRPHRSQNRK